MKKILSSIEQKYRPSTAIDINIKEKRKRSYINSIDNENENQDTKQLSKFQSKAEINVEENNNQDAKYKYDKKDHHNRLSLERINFEFDEYAKYPDEQFQPSVFFFKFLAVKPDYEIEKKHKVKKLSLNIPDTLVFNDSDVNFWIYSDENGKVNRTEVFTDTDVLEKFCSKGGLDKTKEKEVVGVFKSPVYKANLLEGNHIEILNQEELEKHLFSKVSNPSVLQKFIKCRGPKAFLCRSIYRKNKLPYVYIFTNKAGYNENILNQNLKFITNSSKKDSYYIFYANSGKHLEETSHYMNNIVRYIELNTDIILDELACDFIKDEAGIWWMINCKAMKIKNIDKFLDTNGNPAQSPNLEKFCNRRSVKLGDDKIKKFDYQTKLKCKFCGISFNKQNLKYNLTTKMILETDKQLKHLNINLNYIDRPDLSHTDSSMLYLPYRVCEDCYLLFETMNDIKNYQIKIANFFRIKVDHVNFGVDYYIKSNTETLLNLGVNHQLENNFNKQSNLFKSVIGENPMLKQDEIINKKQKYLYRIMILFSDMFWNEEVPVPDKEMYLLFNFLNMQIKAKVKNYYNDLDYFNINFFKIFYVICDPDEGFIEYIDKNRTMQVKLGYFEEKEEKEIKEEKEKLNNNIIIEDEDICQNSEKFVQFASVELSVQGLKYGEKYRNTLNGLLFKEQKPHYTGKLRCTIRINKEKPIDVTKINCRKHMNFYIPPIHFITPEELPDYWLELVERQKLRENILDSIVNTIDRKMIGFDKRKYKEEIFQTLESLISQYLVRDGM